MLRSFLARCAAAYGCIPVYAGLLCRGSFVDKASRFRIGAEKMPADPQQIPLGQDCYGGPGTPWNEDERRDGGNMGRPKGSVSMTWAKASPAKAGFADHFLESLYSACP